MNQNSKSIMAYMSLMLIYILLAEIGAYHMVGVILFPVLSLPLAILRTKSKLPAGLDFLFNVAVIIGIYLFTNSIQSICIYFICICLMSYAVSLFYKHAVPLPNAMMYVSVLLTVAFFIYIGLMKYLEIADYGEQFVTQVNNLKQLYVGALNSIAESGKTSVLQQSISKENVMWMGEVMSKLFPAFILSGCSVLSCIYVILFHLCVGQKEEKIKNLKQLLNFRLSKAAVIVFFLSFIVLAFSNNINNATAASALNIAIFLELLMEVMGIIAFIILISRANTHIVFKIIGYILLVILFIPSASVLVILGCLDTLFNLRKANIVV